MKYPEKLEIHPLAKPPLVEVSVPGSKSITNRALVLAALTCRQSACTLHGVLQSEDTEVMQHSLGQLGFHVEAGASEADSWICVHSQAGAPLIPARQADLFVANSGTSMRFLTALVSLGAGRYRLDGIPRMRQRPIEDLLSALCQLKVNAYSENRDGCPPVIVESNGLAGGLVHIRGDISSQFLSALLLVSPFARSDVTIEVEGPLVSWPYVEMTIAMLRHFGADVAVENRCRFRVSRHSGSALGDYAIEPDASAASYFFGAAAITQGEVSVPGLSTTSLQGDMRFVDVLEQMGCHVDRDSDALTVSGRPLHGIDVDMNDISDCAMTLAVVACFAQGPTTIRNVSHIRHKETDRLFALANELRQVGAEVQEFADGLTITPRPLHRAEIDTYNDHRMAMSMALVGLNVPGVVIRNPACVAKTYPNFFTDLDRLR